MLAYTLKRVLHVVPVALGVSVVCFLLIHIAPGDPLAAILPPDASADLQAQVKAIYGLDRPLVVQYGLWLLRAFQGDLGQSIATGRPVTGEILAAATNTFILAGCATALGFTAGAVLGVLAGIHRGTWIDRLCSGLAMVGVSVPHYWLGLVMVIVFSVTLNWLPATGSGSGPAFSWDYGRYLVLPAITSAVIPTGIIARTVRSLVAEVLAQDFVAALAAKGLLRAQVLRHVLRNVAPTALAVMGLQLGYLLGGSILVETVFSWPGTGFLLNTAIFTRDLPLLQGTILVLASIFVGLNLAVDVLQGAIDPRIQRG